MLLEHPGNIESKRKWEASQKEYQNEATVEDNVYSEAVLTTYGEAIKEKSPNIHNFLTKNDINISNQVLLTATVNQECSTINIIDNSLSPLTRCKKPKYSQINNNNKSKRSQMHSPDKESTTDCSQQKKRRVRFRDQLIDFVDVESFKPYNLKMCFSEISGFYADTKSSSWCKECMSSFSKCSIF